MLLLGDLQERDVVEQQLFERVRRQVQKLFSRAVQQDFLQGLDLALDVYKRQAMPRLKMNAQPVEPRITYEMIKEYLSIEGNATQNLTCLLYTSLCVHELPFCFHRYTEREN